jgi:hypothetical protein
MTGLLFCGFAVVAGSQARIKFPRPVRWAHQFVSAIWSFGSVTDLAVLVFLLLILLVLILILLTEVL